MIDAIILDDEKSAIVTLSNDLLTYCPEVNVRMSFTKPADAIEYIKHNVPDVIFLDINMPVVNGFDFLQTLKKPNASHIIFVTAYNEFAVRAFKVSALDYLLKPIDPSELKAAVQKVMAKKVITGDQGMLFRNFMENYISDGTKGKIAVPVNDGYYLIDPVHIIYCKASGAYTEIVMDNEKSFLVSKTLGRIHELLPVEYFERVHQSYVINCSLVKKFRKGESPVAVMSNNDTVKVSRLSKEKLANRLGIK